MSSTEEQKETSIFMKPQKVILLALALVIIGAVALIIFTQYDPAVALVNGEKIKRSDLYELMYRQSGKDLLESLIIERLILQEGKKSGISVSEADVDAEIEEIIEQHFMGSEDQFTLYLDTQGVTMDTIRHELMINLVAQGIVLADLEITDKEAREYFEENREYFNIPEEVRARHILVETEEEALEMISLLEKGEDFAELAKENSQDPGSKEEGGDLGFFTRGKMVREFEDAAFELADGERSGPVKTYHGYHVIERLEHKDGREVDYGEVADEVNETMRDEKIPQLIQELILRLKEEALIDYRDSKNK